MQSKRDLKKQIRYIRSEVVAECLLLGEVCPDEQLDEVNQLIVDVAILQEGTIAKMSISFDKAVKEFPSRKEYNKARNAYYRKAFTTLSKQFTETLADCVHRMNKVAGLTKDA